MPNARLLSVESGASSLERFARYLDNDAAREAANVVDTAAIAIDRPGEGAAELVRVLRDAGAPAWYDESRFVTAVSRDVLARAGARLAGPAKALCDEVMRAIDADRAIPRTLRLRDRSLDLSQRARVMGILNVTPNSFFDQGKYGTVDRARERAAEMVELGADIIDVGGQSYSSAVAPVTAEEEADRVVPVVRALVRDGLSVPISIDTFRSFVAERALDAGAHLINDCSGLSDDRLAQTVARADAALVVMHIKGRLNVRDDVYRYDDAMADIGDYLRVRTDAAVAAGIGADAITIDPGLEFGKELATDLEILERFGDLRSLGYPILFAASRKSFIGRVFDRPAKELLVPSLATAAVGIGAGARLVRVHDVAETVQIARMLAAVRRDRRDPAPASSPNCAPAGT